MHLSLYMLLQFKHKVENREAVATTEGKVSGAQLEEAGIQG